MTTTEQTAPTRTPGLKLRYQPGELDARLLQLLRASPGGLNPSQLRNRISSDRKIRAALLASLAALQTRGLVICRQVPSYNGPHARWMAVPGAGDQQS